MNRSSSTSSVHNIDSGRSIIPVSTVTTLTATQMQERTIIYRGDKPSAEVDAFRELRTRLLAAAEGNFITLVVPVSAGSGGSFVARNLAAAFALEASKNALLIDCDMRYPAQHKVMHVEAPNGGLIDSLEDTELDINAVVYPTGVARLALLPAGAPSESGAEYFSSQRMQLMLDTLRIQRSDRYIILDGPPVKGAPDARILSDLADLVVLVAGYGKDTPNAIAQAAANFDPSKFAGVVFNEGS